MRIVFARETVAGIWEEAQPLFAAHWREIAHYPDIPFAPDREMYVQLDESGLLRVFTVRLDGQLAGYNAFFVKPHPHYSGSLQAAQDVLFLHPDCRNAGIGIRFIDWCDGELAAEGVQVVTQHLKAAHNHGPLLERLGYELMDLIYTRRLDHGHERSNDHWQRAGERGGLEAAGPGCAEDPGAAAGTGQAAHA